jgi:hypothetical protein
MLWPQGKPRGACAFSDAPILDLKTGDATEDLVAGDDKVAIGQRRRCNPKVVVVEIESLAFDRCLETP